MNLLAQGDERSLLEIISRHKNKLYMFILKYIKDEDSAYDILQETFIRLYCKANSYNSKYAFSSWLYRIAMNLCRDWSRKQKLVRFLSLDWHTEVINEDITCGNLEHHCLNLEEVVDNSRLISELETAIDALPHKLKSAIILYAVAEHSQSQCAEILGVTPKVVEMRIYRARKAINKKLLKFRV